MPVLEILTPEGDLYPASGHLLTGFAIYPSNEFLQQEFAYVTLFNSLLAQGAGSPGQDESLPAPLSLAEIEEMVPTSGYELLEILLLARPQDQVIREANKSLKRADVAGKLALLWLMAHNDPEVGPVGVTKAADALLDILDDEHSREEFGSVGRTTLFNCWSEFKSVAHIHAAIELIGLLDQETLDLVIDSVTLLPETESSPSSAEDFSFLRDTGQQVEMPENLETDTIEPGEEAVFFFLDTGLPVFISLVESLRLKFLEIDIEFGKQLYTFPDSIDFEPRDLEIPPLSEEMRYLFL